MGGAFRILSIGVVAAACGGAVAEDAGGGAGAEGGTAAGPQGGSGVATGGSAGAALFEDLVAITSDRLTELTATACAGTQMSCEITPHRVELVVDLSASMTRVAPGSSRTSWELVRDGLRAAIARPLPPNVREAGVLFFPNRPTAANLGSALPAPACISSADDVPIAPNESSFPAMDSALARVEPNPDAGAPIHDAYRMAVDALSEKEDEFLPVVVLVTDGHPTFELGCYGIGLASYPVDPEPIIAEIANAYEAGILTLVVGAPGSADARSWLSRAAREGGTARPACSDEGPVFCHIDMTEEPDLGLAVFRWLAVPCFAPLCTWNLPVVAPGAQLDLAQLSLVYLNPAGTYLVQRAADPSAACTRGWHDSADGTQIEICPETCDLIQSTFGEIEILVGCVRGPSLY
jgi:hypothetical protein